MVDEASITLDDHDFVLPSEDHDLTPIPGGEGLALQAHHGVQYPSVLRAAVDVWTFVVPLWDGGWVFLCSFFTSLYKPTGSREIDSRVHGTRSLSQKKNVQIAQEIMLARDYSR